MAKYNNNASYKNIKPMGGITPVGSDSIRKKKYKDIKATDSPLYNEIRYNKIANDYNSFISGIKNINASDYDSGYYSAKTQREETEREINALKTDYLINPRTFGFDRAGSLSDFDNVRNSYSEMEKTLKTLSELPSESIFEKIPDIDNWGTAGFQRENTDNEIAYDVLSGNLTESIKPRTYWENPGEIITESDIVKEKEKERKTREDTEAVREIGNKLFSDIYLSYFPTDSLKDIETDSRESLKNKEIYKLPTFSDSGYSAVVSKKPTFYFSEEEIYKRYLEDIAEYRANIAESAERVPVMSSIMSVVALPLVGLEQIYRYIQSGVTGFKYNYYNMFALAQSEIRNTVSDMIGNDMGKQIYQLAMSSLDSLLGLGISSVTGGVGGPLALGMSAASNTWNDGIDRGISGPQLLFTSAAAGIAEAIFEKISFGNLNVLKEITPSGIIDILKNMAKSAGVNASEEFFTEAANILSDTFINGDKSEWQTEIDYYKEHGYTDVEAAQKVLGKKFLQCMEAGASGAVQGLLFSGGASVYTSVRGSSLGGNTNNSTIDAVKALGATLDPDSRGYKLAQGLSGESGNLYKGAAVSEVLSEVYGAQTAAALSETIASAGYEGDASALAEELLKSSETGTLSQRAIRDMNSSAVTNELYQIWTVLTPPSENIGIYEAEARSKYSYPNAENRALADFVSSQIEAERSSGRRRSPSSEDIENGSSVSDNVSDSVSEADVSPYRAGTVRSGEVDYGEAGKRGVSSVSRTAFGTREGDLSSVSDVGRTVGGREGGLSSVSGVGGRFSSADASDGTVSSSGRTKLRANVPAVDSRTGREVEIQAYKGREDGKIIFQTNVGEADIDSVRLPASLRSAIEYAVQNYDGNTVNTFLKFINGNETAFEAGLYSAYAEAFDAFYNLGRLNYGTLSFENAAALSPESLKFLGRDAAFAAYNMGKRVAENERDSVGENKKTPRRTVKRKGEGKYINKASDSSLDEVYLQLAKKFGINIERVRKAGKNVRGQFVPDIMTIVLSEEDSNEYQTMGHELAEFAAEFNPEQMSELYGALMKYALYSAENESDRRAILNIVRRYEREYSARVKKTSYKEASEEYLNNVLGRLLASPSNAERFAAWLFEESGNTAEQNRSILQTLVDLINRIIDKINEFLKGAEFSGIGDAFKNAETRQAKAAVDKFLEILDRAIENAEKASVAEDGGMSSVDNKKTVKFSFDIYDERQRENWKNSKRIILYENNTQFKKFIDDSLNNNSSKKIYFGKISNDLADEIKRSTGIDVNGYNCSLSGNEIRKIINSHGNSSKEALRGQRAINANDILNIPYVILSSDEIYLSDRLYNGKPVINFVSYNNEKFTVSAVVSDKHLDLFVQTAYINMLKNKGNLATPISEQADINTPEASSGTVSNDILSQNDKNVNTNYTRDGEKYSSGENEGNDVRFSLDVNVEETENLIAVHNMQVSELEKTLSLGGLPMPSIAITKANIGHDEYGPVSVVFYKDTIDPSLSRKNKVYGGDAWTSTFPAIEYKPNRRVGEKIRNKYYELARSFGYEAARPLYNLANNTEDALNSAKGEANLKEDLYKDTALMNLYRQDHGLAKIEDVYDTRTETMSEADIELSRYLSENLSDVLKEAQNYGTKSPYIHRRNVVSQNLDAIKRAYSGYLSSEFGFTDEQISNVLSSSTFRDFVKIISNALEYAENGGKKEVRTFNGQATIDKITEETDQSAYRKWVDDLVSGIEEKTGILKNDVDFYTPSGNRRSFEALHAEYTLENIVREMKKGDVGNGFLAGQSIWGVSAKTYENIEEIKKDSARLKRISYEEMQQIRQSFTERLAEVGYSLADNNAENMFIEMENVTQNIIDAVRASKSKSGILNYLRQYYPNKITDTIVDDIVSLVADISNMPTEYFEAKPERAVGFDEIASIVLPDTAGDEIKTRLDELNINHVEYEDGNTEARLEALNSIPDVKFSLDIDADEEINFNAAKGENNYGREVIRKDSEERTKILQAGYLGRGNSEIYRQNKGKYQREKTETGKTRLTYDTGRNIFGYEFENVPGSKMSLRSLRASKLFTRAGVEAYVFDPESEILMSKNGETEQKNCNAVTVCGGQVVLISNNLEEYITGENLFAHELLHVYLKSNNRILRERAIALHNAILQNIIPDSDYCDFIFGIISSAYNNISDIKTAEEVAAFISSDIADSEDIISKDIFRNPSEVLRAWNNVFSQFNLFDGGGLYSLDIDESLNEEDVRFLIRENEELSELNRYLKEELRLSRGKLTDANEVRHIAATIREEYGSALTVEEIFSALKTFYDSVGEGVFTGDYIDIVSRDIAARILENSKYNREVSEENRAILKEIREYPITFNEEQKREAAYLYGGSFNEYRTRNFGRLRLVNESEVSLDAFWQEMNDKYPWLFDADISPAEMPARLLEVVGALSETYDDPNGLTFEDASYLLATEIKEKYVDSRRSTFADRKKAEREKAVAREKKRGREKLAEVKKTLREEYNGRLREVRERNAEKTRNLRADTKNKLERQQAKYRDMIVRKSLRQKETAEKNKFLRRIRRNVKTLNSLLVNETDARHIPEDLKKAVAGFLKCFAEDSGVFTKERLLSLKDVYSRIEEASGDDPLFKYNAFIDSDIRNDITELTGLVNGRRLSQLSSAELREVTDIVGNVSAMINYSNAIFYNEKKEALDNTVYRARNVINEERKRGDKVKRVFQNSLAVKEFTPVYLFKRLGGVFEELHNDILDGVDKYMVISDNAKSFYYETEEKYNFLKWDKRNKELVKITTASGETLSFTGEQALSLYATAKRERLNYDGKNADHIGGEGIVLKDKKYKNTYHGTPLTANEVNEVIAALPGNARAFADEIVSYMSEELANEGNEASTRLFGIEKFKEPYYFPYTTADFWKPMKISGDVNSERIKHLSFTRRTTSNARSAIVIGDFTDVFFSHAEGMAKYSALALPQENLLRVMNYKSGGNSVKNEIAEVYGESVVRYIEKYLADISGATVSDDMNKILNRALSYSKKASIAFNNSVAIQQISSVVRAMNIISPRYFDIGGIPFSQAGREYRRRFSQNYEEMKEYCPIAQIKEIGGVDTGTGTSMLNWMKDGIKDGGIKDVYNVVDDAGSRLPNFADKLAWSIIWNAVKSETKAKNPAYNGEVLLQAAAKRFREVIYLTQVVDVVTAKSEYMRNKSFGWKVLTSYMSEPTLTFNMLLDSATNSGNRAAPFRRSLATWTFQTILNALLKSIILALRDDDEDKTYLEKYLGTFTEETIGDLVLLNMIPVGRDVWSILEGYTLKRNEMAYIDTAIATIEETVKLFNGSETADIFGIINSTLTMAGIPVLNSMREIAPLVTSMVKGWGGEEKDVGKQIKYSITDALSFTQYLKWNNKNYEGLANKIAKGDEKAFNEMYDDIVDYLVFYGKSEKEAKTTVRSQLTRIFKKKYKAGTASERDSIRKSLIKTGIYTDSDIDLWDKETAEEE